MLMKFAKAFFLLDSHIAFKRKAGRTAFCDMVNWQTFDYCIIGLAKLIVTQDTVN